VSDRTFLNAYKPLTGGTVVPGAQQKQVSAVATVPPPAEASATDSPAVVLAFVNQTLTLDTAHRPTPHPAFGSPSKGRRPLADLRIRLGLNRTYHAAQIRIPADGRKSLTGLFFACAGLFGVATVAATPTVRADAVASLVNVMVRPGYNFPNADAALSYRHGICDKVSGPDYAQVIADVKADVATSDEYQASYLISRVVNELCPALIWQLRNSAARYRPPRADKEIVR
jgi:hypothetical protein